MANEKAGPGVLLSFLVGGVASACAALSYAEFASMIPKAGSTYTYGYVVLGEGVGWFIGWNLLLEYTAIVAVAGLPPVRRDRRRAQGRRTGPSPDR